MEALDKALDEAQSELASAEIGLAEATARADTARGAQQRLVSAVAALNGESASPTPPTKQPVAEERSETAGMTPEQFDAHRKKRQRQKKKELDAQNPYAQVKCSGCGSKGTLVDTVIQAPSGTPLRMLVCGSCGNQIMQ